MEWAPASLSFRSMRRFLIGLTLTVLLIVSIGIGMAVANWPQWRHFVSHAAPTLRAAPGSR
jgi:hypothetical protein